MAASSGRTPASVSRARASAIFSERDGSALMSDRGRFFQLLGVVEGGELIDQLAGIALEDVVQAVGREVDAVIGDAALREVIRADFLRALAGADLAAALLRHRLLLFADLHLVEARAQHLHRLRAVLDLRLLVLLRHDEPRWNVRQPYGRVRRVDAVTAWPARTERVDAQVPLVDLNVDFLGFWQHRDGRRRRVDAS